MGELVVGEEDFEAVVTEEERGKTEEEERGMVLRWEKFLPSMLVRVLLVEFDDSTRQIIAALLRKCSYKVAAVQDGKRAWEILKENPDNFDLVLSEVSLPMLSGFGLLSLIAGHPICKSIPVIMMSSHDSINIVFKCMLQGAVDFLVKPIRKNELKNLWQHVWRRRSVNDGGNGLQIPDPVENKIETVSDNSSSSNGSSDYANSMLKKRENSAKASDTQTSCTRSGMEDKHLNQCTVGEFLSSPKEHNGCLLGGNEATETFTPQAAKAITTNMDVQTDESCEKHNMLGESRRQVTSKMVSSLDIDYNYKRHHPREAIDFLGQIGKDSTGQKEHISTSFEEGDGSEEAFIPNNSNIITFLPHEISVKRPRLHGYPQSWMDDKHVLNHSDASPFMRYSRKIVLNTTSATCVSSDPKEVKNCPHTSIESQFNGSPGIVFSPKPIRCDTLTNEASASNRIHCQSHTASPERISPVKQPHGHLGDTSPRSSVLKERTEFSASHVRYIPVLLPVTNFNFEGLSSGYGTILQPVFYAQEGPPPWMPLTSDKQEAVERTPIQQSDPSRRGEMPESHLHQDTNPPTHQLPNNTDTSAETEEDHGVPSSSQSRSSLFNCSMNYYNMNSDGGVSNGNVGKTTDTTMRCGVEGLYSGIGEAEYSRSAQRSAALAKFRMKRKERCFEKKVRYESRKILAEQRPRVKGQFVRQVPHES